MIAAFMWLYSCTCRPVLFIYLFIYLFHFISFLSLYVSDARKCVGDACVISIKRICLQVSVCLLIWTKAQRVKLTTCGGFHTFIRRHLVCQLIIDYCPFISRRISHNYSAPRSSLLSGENIICDARADAGACPAEWCPPTSEFKVGDGWSARCLRESYNGAIS